VRLGQMVTCNSYRNPALLAKMASTVDALSQGRLDFGIGAGWYEEEYVSYGYAFPSTSERLERLREAVEIILAMWTQEEATFEGTYYQMRGAINQPKGVQKPHIPLLIGGGGEKVTLRLVAEYANACNIGGDIPTIKHKLAILKQHCDKLGRDYESIKRTTLIDDCVIADTEADVLAKLTPQQQDNLEELRKTWLIGTPEQIRERLMEYEEAGIQELIVRFVDAAQLEPVRLFARECIQRG
jgi:alkanesulfonate monooxygenase SsuD/methylene tetrahydromethanopterin reductase-like flavin-dependent oxidoreductase (luciferase family)